MVDEQKIVDGEQEMVHRVGKNQTNHLFLVYTGFYGLNRIFIVKMVHSMQSIKRVYDLLNG